MRSTLGRLLCATLLSLPLTAVGCGAASEDEDASDSSTSEDHLLAGRVLTESEAASVVRNAGFPESEVGKMLCTIKYESSFYERALNTNKNGTSDYGLLQVNSVHLGETGCPTSAASLYTASVNAACAYRIFKHQGSGAWYGYRNHQAECDLYPAPP